MALNDHGGPDAYPTFPGDMPSSRVGYVSQYCIFPPAVPSDVEGTKSRENPPGPPRYAEKISST